ncbi:MAG: hypothetical protein V4580_12575, partial [Bacteroidota bacterium]
NSNTLTLSNGSAITTATVPVQSTVTGSGVANVTPAGNNYLVNVPMSTYNNTTGVFSTGAQTITVTPTLTLAGNILRSGPTTNTVSLASLNTWSLSSGVLFPATLTNSIAVGTSGPLTDRMEISHPSSTGSTQLHLKQTGADAFSRIKFTNAAAPTKFWLSTVTSAASDANSGHNFFYNNGTIGHNVFTVAGDGRVSVNTFSTMTNAIMDVNGALEIDSTFVVNAVSSPPQSSSNSGKIFFDATSQKFKVSENGGVYVNLVNGPSPWLQGSGLIHLTNSTDNVGIGTTSPVASLDVSGNIRVNDKLFFGAVGGINSGYTGIYSENDDLKFAVFKPGAPANAFAPASNSMDAVIIKSQTGNVGIGINAPASPLHVANAAGSQFRIGNNNQPAYEWIWDVNATSHLSLINEGNGTPVTRMNIDVNTGYTGFGTGNTLASSMVEVGSDGSLDKGLRVTNTGPTVGPSIYFKGQSKDWTITGSNSASGAGANKLVFRDYSAGLDRMVIDGSGNVGIGTTNPSSRLEVFSTGVPPTINATNNGSGHGIFGTTASNVSAGVMGVNDNTGPSVAGVKVSPATGNVANFKNTNTTNSGDALVTQTDGTGAALHTINGASSIGSSNIGVLIEEGHIGTASSTNLTATSSCACSAPSITMDSHSTDVAGTLRAVYSTTTGAVVDINVTFAKPYKKYPVVIVTPGSHPSFSYTQFIVVPIGAAGNYTGFKISVESGINSSAGAYVYNYMVIEGKN